MDRTQLRKQSTSSLCVQNLSLRYSCLKATLRQQITFEFPDFSKGVFVGDFFPDLKVKNILVDTCALANNNVAVLQRQVNEHAS